MLSRVRFLNAWWIIRVFDALEGHIMSRNNQTAVEVRMVFRKFCFCILKRCFENLTD